MNLGPSLDISNEQMTFRNSGVFGTMNNLMVMADRSSSKNAS